MSNMIPAIAIVAISVIDLLVYRSLSRRLLETQLIVRTMRERVWRLEQRKFIDNTKEK